MQEWVSWMGTPRAAGFVAGSWCCAAAALVANTQSPGAPWGADLLRWLASDGVGPGMLPITIAAIVALIHAMLIREARGRCCQEWIDAAWSLGLVAAGMAAWTWALHYEPFADPFSASRRLAALAGLGALLVGAGMTISVAIATERKTERPVERRQFRRSYQAIG
ncbi:MAG TPA: hypothetical protein VFM14_06855 [Gemmatimonadales bacterium]|nr:hypothetical protein [Gemmatimonadales bacterium]